MKLTKKHIGGLFYIEGSDGSWVYQLADVKNGRLLFFEIGDGKNNWVKERVGEYSDWRPFTSLGKYAKEHIKEGWNIAEGE